MKELLYVGKFHPWTEKHCDELFDALNTFDRVYVCVMFNKGQKKFKKGQPSKVLESDLKDKIKIVYFKSLKTLLKGMKDCKYIMFER